MINEAEKMKKIKVKLEVSPENLNKIITIIEFALINKDLNILSSVVKNWNAIRKNVVQMLVPLIFKNIESQVKEMLVYHAEKYIIEEAYKSFYDLLVTEPFKHKSPILMNNLTNEWDRQFDLLLKRQNHEKSIKVFSVYYNPDNKKVIKNTYII